MSTLHALCAHLAQHPLLSVTQRMVVAVSGGPDSCALLHALCHVFPRSHIAVFHLDHGLRGAQSAADARFVATLATQLGVAVQCDLADIAHEAPEYRNLSEAARVIRYRRMATYAAAQHADVVLVAHTQDDQAETVLMRLLRGSGTHGLAAMRAWLPWQDWAPADILGNAALVRPLLDISRATILDYCATTHLTPRHDPSNTNQQALRVRVRTQLLPQLRHEQPQITAILAQSAQLTGDDADFIASMVDTHWPQVVVHYPGWIAFVYDRFCALHISLQRATIRRAIRTVYGTLRGVNFAHIDAIRDAIITHTAPAISLPTPMRVQRLAQHVGIGEPPAIAAPTVVGTSHVISHTQPLHCGAFVLTMTTQVVSKGQHPWCVVLDARHSYTLRTRHRGDRIGIGNGHHRRIQDVFVDARIPVSQRDTWPLVCCDDVVVWVVGVRADPRFCVTIGATGVQLACHMPTQSTV